MSKTQRAAARDFLWFRVLGTAAWIGVFGSLAWADPLAIHGPGIKPEDFRVTTFAAGLNYPLGMARLSDGSLLVATSNGTNYWNSIGELVRLVDADQDGVADGPGTVLYSGLKGGLASLRLAGSLVFVSGQDRPISLLRLGAVPYAPLTFVGDLKIQYPTTSWEHPQSGVAVRPSPPGPQPSSVGSSVGAEQRYDVIFQVGSAANFAATALTASLSSSDIPGASGTLLGDSLYSLTLIDNGTNVTATNLTRLAGGLRNAAGCAFDPVTGDLYFEDNGIDGLVDPNEPLSADELNVIPAADIGRAPIPFFGFPDNYVEYRTGKVVGGQGVQPLIAFQPQPDPLTGEESEGPNEIAFAPRAFPAPFSHGIFLGFHGKFGQGGTDNEENAMAFVDLSQTNYFHFTSSRQPGIGHLDGLFATEDSLFVADLTRSGGFVNGNGTGVIYQIQSLVPPSVGIRWANQQIELTWTYGFLQSAARPSSPWADVPNATSPYLVGPGAQQTFFRARK